MSYPKIPQHAIDDIKTFLLDFQEILCHQMEELDGQAHFLHDKWKRPEGGGGISCIMKDGGVFESAGINFSHISGKSLPKAATQTRKDLAEHSFEALGISIVFHPQNPFVPTTHLNIRFFISETGVWWFGGGFDLTPYYPFEDDCVAWHKFAYNASPSHYAAWKKNCDDYFYLPHRQETRGIGGIFFDDFYQPDFNTCFEIWKKVGLNFWEAYQSIVKKRQDLKFTQEQKEFQLYRRGRYVEFNLLYDRGTLFGIQSNGRTESILMSLPPEVHFKYNWQPKENSLEETLYLRYLKPQDWLKT